uniref:(northern house mosquito) hypothetical protein n=1 Tax=Culex pipiens TaxID=7175 RepID=A0A8D8GJE2_CULPI
MPCLFRRCLTSAFFSSNVRFEQNGQAEARGAGVATGAAGDVFAGALCREPFGLETFGVSKLARFVRGDSFASGMDFRLAERAGGSSSGASFDGRPRMTFSLTATCIFEDFFSTSLGFDGGTGTDFATLFTGSLDFETTGVTGFFSTSFTLTA